MNNRINAHTEIIYEGNNRGIIRAAEALRRDILKCCCESEAADEAGTGILLKQGNEMPEMFRLYMSDGFLVTEAFDALGFIYGLYEISRTILGVKPFWFWNDQVFTKRKTCDIPEGFHFESSPFAVKYRGWFVNDEVLIDHWKTDGSSDRPWEMVFEALLRLGGNMVIPGTDTNSKKYDKLASEMGLIITHHHAEPMGAEMFARAYPELVPSYDENSELYIRLWKEAILRQKNERVIWNLGFRGQGDRPFWEDDPKYSSPESRGQLMGDLIRVQYDLVRAELPDAVCCTNLYGETMELYQGGYLHLPEDIILIWADNGFGKMVSRRQMNHNPRIPALPEEKRGRHGIYYHVSFYDLQAASHMTALPNEPSFVQKELSRVMQAGADDYWIINCSNVKPHVYYLDFVASFWHKGNIDIDAHMKKYITDYYASDCENMVARCMYGYWESAPLYGINEDDHAGDQFANHPLRMLVSQFMRNRNSRTDELLWATDSGDLEGQIGWYQNICRSGADRYQRYLGMCEETALQIKTSSVQTLFRDSILLQGRLMAYAYEGAVDGCTAMMLAMEEKYMEAFYYAGRAKKAYLAADGAMREREHGKWIGFYRNDSETAYRLSAYLLGTFMGYLRNIDDGPHFYKWQRELQYEAKDSKIALLLVPDSYLEDDEIMKLIEAREKFC